MNTFLRNTISKLYIAVPAPMAATRDALTERLQSVLLLYCITESWRIWDMDSSRG